MPSVSIVDYLKISRPGWWIVTIWLYVAPATSLGWTFWAGLLYVCLPLNALMYGLNDYADIDIDQNNKRKGNWFFGPKGMTRNQLRPLLQVAICGALVPLVALGWYQGQLIRYLAWYALGMIINVAYNFPILGHLSSNGPWEIPLVYVGFAMVTVLSYWLNGNSGDAIGWEDVLANETDPLLFGCNKRYWTHLAFLVVRSQLWTELLDYEADRAQKRGTTLAKFSSKSMARSLVFTVLLAEVTWNWQQYQDIDDWRNLWLFSVLGVFSFVGMEYAAGGNLKPKPESFLLLALVQSSGGFWLIRDCWNKGVFVA